MPSLLAQFGEKDAQQTSRGGKPTAKDHAETLGWNTSFDLDRAVDEDAVFRVLHFQEQLDTVSRKIATAANTAIEESGTNMLYLVFGFLGGLPPPSFLGSKRTVLVSGSFEEIAGSIERFCHEMRTALEVMEISDNVRLRELPGVVSLARECRQAMAALQADVDVPVILGDAYRGVTTDIEPIEQTVQFAASIASGTL